jgi:hypothetical protein
VPIWVSSFRLLTLSGGYGMLSGRDCNNNMLRDSSRVKRGDTVGLGLAAQQVHGLLDFYHAAPLWGKSQPYAKTGVRRPASAGATHSAGGCCGVRWNGSLPQ